MIMNNKIASALIFGAGAAVGSIVTWQLLKTAYEKIARESIAEVKAYYEEKHADLEREVEQEPVRYRRATPEEIARREKEEEQYEQLVSDYADISTDEGEPKFYDGPFVISPSEYGDSEEFDTCGLTYYADGVLVDDDTQEIITDADDIVGDFATHFGEYEPDSVHVRNPRMRMDYEILFDLKPYSELFSNNPHRKEVE
jgi:hypothetical protein